MSDSNLNAGLCSRVSVWCEMGAHKLDNGEKIDGEPGKEGSEQENGR